MSVVENGTDPYISKFNDVIEAVKRLEDALETLEENMNENHREALESIRELQDSGSGFSTFES